MLTNKALEAITDFLSNVEKAGFTSENYIPWDETEPLFAGLSETYFKEVKCNLLNLNREDAALYLCEAVESLSRFSDLILPNNDEINSLLVEYEAQNSLILALEQTYSAALTDRFSDKVEFQINLESEYFQAEALTVCRDFREEVHRQLADGSFNPDTMPGNGWAWIYAEQISFFLESIWLRVIELYERRCGAVPEKLHWHSNSQWVKQHRLEMAQLAVREAILNSLLAYDADESGLVLPTAFKMEKAALAIAEPAQPGNPAPDKGCPHIGDTLDTAPTAAAALTVADLCREGFTPADVLALAREVGLADESGRFCLWSRKPGTKPRKLGAVVGFCKALGGDAKGVTTPPLTGTIPERVRAVGVLLDVEIHTTKTGTGVAKKYRKATEQALARRKPTH